MRIANPFRYSILPFNGYAPGSIACVFKMWFGKTKYFIWKSPALYGTVNAFSKDIDQRLRLGLKGPGDIYTKIVAYIKKARVSQFEVEVLFISDNPVDLLKTESEILQKSISNDNCLNMAMTPYIPKWIPDTAVNEYNLWKQKLREDARRKKAKKSNKAVHTGRNTRKKRSVQNGSRRDSGVRCSKKNLSTVKKGPEGTCKK
jgi:hypothetical protein